MYINILHFIIYLQGVFHVAETSTRVLFRIVKRAFDNKDPLTSTSQESYKKPYKGSVNTFFTYSFTHFILSYCYTVW